MCKYGSSGNLVESLGVSLVDPYTIARTVCVAAVSALFAWPTNTAAQSRGFEKKATWEETEEANRAPRHVIVPEKWLMSLPRGIGDIRYDYLGGRGHGEDMPEIFGREEAPAKWRFATPELDGTVPLAEVSLAEWNTERAYTEYESEHDDLALFSFGCIDGWRLDLNGRQLIYAKWRKGNFAPNQFQMALKLQRGTNRIYFPLMRRAGTGAFQLTIRPLGRRIDLLLFLIRAFPEEPDRAAAAGDELLSSFDMLGLSERHSGNREQVGQLYDLLRPKIESGKHNDGILAVFTDLSARFAFFERGEVEMIGRALSERPLRDPRLIAAAIAYQWFAGSQSEVPGLLRKLSECGTGEGSWPRLFHESCRHFRMYEDGIAVLSQLAKTTGGQASAELTARVADLHEKSGQYSRAAEIYGSLVEHEQFLRQSIRVSPQAEAMDLKNRSRTSVAILPTPFGLDETLRVIRNTIDAGEAERAAASLLEQADLVRDMVVYSAPDRAIDAFDHLMRQTESFPNGFREILRGIIRERTEDVFGLEDVQVTLRKSWDFLQGKGQVNRLAVDSACRLLDEGNFQLAKAWYKAAWIAERRPETALGLAFASHAARDGEVFDYVKASLSPAERKAKVTIAGRPTTLGTVIDSMARPASAGGTGRPSGGGYVTGWRARAQFAPKVVAAYARVLLRPEVSPWVKWLPRSSTPIRMLPALSGDTLVVHTGWQLEGFSLRTGKRLWRAARAQNDVRGGRSKVPTPVFRPAVHPGVVITRVPKTIAAGADSRSDAFRLCAVALENGRLLWSRDNACTDPVLSEGLLYFNSIDTDRSEDAVMYAEALDPLTGRCVWRRTLLSGYDRHSEERILREVTAPLVTPRGVMFSTSFGVVAMLHPLTGGVAWLRRYDRPPRSLLFDRYHVNRAFYADGLAIITPRDSHRAIAFNAETGETAWQISTGRSPCAGGTAGGRFILVGESIRVIDVKTGKELAKRPVKLPTLPYAWVSGKDLLVCGLSDFTAFDLRTLADAKPPVRLGKGQYFFHPVGDSAVVQCEESFTVLGRVPGTFGKLDSERLIETTMLNLKDGIGGQAHGASKNPEDNAMLRMLAIKKMRSGSAESIAQTRALLSESGRLGAVPWRSGHHLRPAQFAHRALGDGLEAGRPARAPPAGPGASLLPAWVREGGLAGISTPSTDRGVMLVWGDSSIELLNMTGSGESIWRRRTSDQVASVSWLEDLILVRWLTGNVTALDLYTGETRWKETDPEQLLKLVGARGGVLKFVRSKSQLVCMDPRSGEVSWQVSLPGKRYPWAVHNSSVGPFLLSSTSIEELQDWELRRIDVAGGQLTTQAFADHRSIPVEIRDRWLITAAARGLNVMVRDVGTGKQIWQGTFTQPSFVRRLERPGGDGFLLAVHDGRTGRCRGLVDPVNGKEIIDVRKESVRYHEGEVYLFDSGKRLLSKVTTGTGTAKTRASEPDDVDENLSDVISVDLGLGVARTERSDDDIRLVDWERSFAGAATMSLHWAPGTLRVLEGRDGLAATYRLALRDGKESDRAVLLAPTSDIRGMAWHHEGRYCTVRTDRELYCFRLVEARAAGLAEMKKAVGVLQSRDDIVRSLRGLRLAEELVRDAANTASVCRGSLQLRDGSRWIPWSQGKADVAASHWGGEEDVSGSLRVAAEPGGGLRFVVEVRDDNWRPFRAGADGDCVRFDVPGATFSIGMDAAGRPATEILRGGNDEAPPPVRNPSCRMLSAERVRYSFVVPGGGDGRSRPAGKRAGSRRTPAPRGARLNFSVAILDDDGLGYEGQLEWGKGRGQLVLR